MTRKSFVFSWGRKIFFGFSWPISCLLGLVYLQSYLFPQGTVATIYFFISYIAVYGLLNAAAYFLLYCPVIFLMPAYYVCRFWSLIIVLCLNFFILIDALIFSQYRGHLDSFYFQYLTHEGPVDLFHFKPFYFVAFIGAFIFLVSFWLRGERLWKVMQKRFSNPNHNWYLVLIFVCGVASTLMFYNSSDNREKLASAGELFPLALPKYVKGEEIDVTFTPYQKVYYPSQEMKCTGRSNPNLVMIVVKNWSPAEEDLDLLHHLSTHGKYFTEHMAVSSDSESGIFSLLYGLSPLYLDSIKENKINPEIFEEMKKRKYEFLLAGNEEVPGAELFNRNGFIKGTHTKIPFFMFHYVNSAAKMSEIYQLFSMIQKEGQISNTLFVITSDYSDKSLKVPFFMVGRKQTGQLVPTVSSHYDLVPTLMSDLWDCKNHPRQYSQGVSMNGPAKEWFPVGRATELQVFDTQTKEIMPMNVKDFSDKKSEKILGAIREINYFFKKH
jgi:uncharacterized protein